MYWPLAEALEISVVGRSARHSRRVPPGAIWSLVLELELELGLYKPIYGTESGAAGGSGRARALRVRSVSREGAWASAGVQGAWISGCGCEAD